MGYFTFTVNGKTYTSDPSNTSVPDGYRFIGYGYVSALANLVGDIQAEMDTKRLDAASSALDALHAADSASYTAGAEKWMTGTDYPEGIAVWSPTDLQTYRRKYPGGVSDTDPSGDADGWSPVGITPDGIQTIKNKTLVGGEISAALINEAKGLQIPSADEIDLDVATGNMVHVTGSTDVTKIKLAPGASRDIVFDATLTLRHSDSLILPGAANIVTSAGDRATFRGDDVNVARCMHYTKADGSPVAGMTGVPVGGLVPIYSDTLPNTIVDGLATYLKSGVVDAAATYPNAPSGPYMAQTVTNSIDLSGRHPAFGNTKYVIPTAGGVAVSTDLFSWSVVTLAGVTADSTCSFLNGKFIVFQANGDKVYTSADAVAWTEVVLPISGAWLGVAWSGTRYVAVCGSSSTSIVHSADAANWTALDLAMTANDVAYGGGKFVIVGVAGGNGAVKYSSDGLAWNNAASIYSQNPQITWRFVAWNGAWFVTTSFSQYDAGYSVYKIWGMRSSDGSNWLQFSTPQQSSNSYCEGIAVSGATFFLGAKGNAPYYPQAIGWYSTDNGSTWTQISGPNRQYMTPFPCCLTQGKMAINGNTILWGGGLLKLDGTPTNTQWHGLDFGVALKSGSVNAMPADAAFGNGLYVSSAWVQYGSAYGAPVSFVGISKDGVNFAARSVGYQDTWSGAAYFNSKYVIGGLNNVITSADGNTWGNTAITAGVLRVANTKLFAFRDSFASDPSTPTTSANYNYTNDAVTWNSIAFPQQAPYVVAYGGGKYMMLVGNGNSYGYAYTSDDGVNSWTQKGAWPNGHSQDSRGLVYAYGAFYRFGKDGKIAKSTDLGVTWGEVSTKNGAFVNCDWAKTDGATIIAGANGTGDYVISKDGVNFFVRKAPLKQLAKWGSFVNGEVLSSQNYPFGVLNASGDYVLNDRAQFASESTTRLGTQLYMRVK